MYIIFLNKKLLLLFLLLLLLLLRRRRRRRIGKCVTRVAKQDVINASGAMQVCAGQKSGGEAAIHAMRNIFEADETDAALLVDASNAFNSLNRAAALNNIRVLCPLIATYVTNTYRVPARLFVVGGSELKSAEGTTQGDPLAMSMYAISLQPLISLLHNRSTENNVGSRMMPLEQDP